MLRRSSCAGSRTPAIAALCLFLQLGSAAQSVSVSTALAARLQEVGGAPAASVYQASGNHPLWTAACRPTAQARALIAAFARSADLGLNPLDYGSAAWPARLLSLEELPTSVCTDAAADFDVALTLAAERYLTDLNRGRYNPAAPPFKAVIGGRTWTLPKYLVDRLARAGDVASAIAAAEPQYPGYWRTVTALRRYIALAAAGDVAPLPASPKPVQPGRPYAAAPLLARRLEQLGYLRSSAPADRLYSKALVGAVQRFQARHALAADGVLGPSTLAALNVPLAQRVLQIRAVLDRWRRLPALAPGPRVTVNIPEFTLRAFSGGRAVLRMKVVDGMASGRQTPALSSRIHRVIFRPYWTAPRSIVRSAIEPGIRRDPEYLVNNSLELLTPGGRVLGQHASAADLVALRAGALEVRQGPGPSNSLGLVKFVFPNAYNIYMHDTPEKSLFNFPRSDFSHGCVRLQRPADLAALLLSSVPGWTPAAIAAAMHHGPNDHAVSLPAPVPVDIVYLTVWVKADGTVEFFPDIYDRDAPLKAQFAADAPAT